MLEFLAGTDDDVVNGNAMAELLRLIDVGAIVVASNDPELFAFPGGDEPEESSPSAYSVHDENGVPLVIPPDETDYYIANGTRPPRPVTDPVASEVTAQTGEYR